MSFVDPHSLQEQLGAAVAAHPERTAIDDPQGRRITYRELDALTDRLRDRLRSAGAQPGDRIGVVLRKSLDSIATLYGILKTGAAYVPVDWEAPARRNSYILANCGVTVAVVESDLARAHREELAGRGARPRILELDSSQGGLDAALTALGRDAPAPPSPSYESEPDDLAYILYTSGSTGRPKGVVLSHANALSFLGWCSDTFAPEAGERFSSHAPLHFDLSILDVHLALKHGAAVVPVPEAVGRDPQRLADLIEKSRITSWYSSPSILSLLAQHGRLGERDLTALRRVLFAGEVFPIKHFRTLQRTLPAPEYFNLYGPTETNVCTYYQVTETVSEERTEPLPIGRACEHVETRILDAAGDLVDSGEGELCVAGPAVTRGYWDLPERTAAAFVAGAADWYRTGDVVRQLEDGGYLFLGRRDRMIKKRGYRIELGEIEACLYEHPEVLEVAVVAAADERAGMKVTAHLGFGDGAPPSIISLKTFCAARLPSYMIPDVFIRADRLPRTSTDKVDYQALTAG